MAGESSHAHSHGGHFHTHDEDQEGHRHGQARFQADGETGVLEVSGGARPFRTRIAELRAAEHREKVNGGGRDGLLAYADGVNGDYEHGVAMSGGFDAHDHGNGLVHSHGGSSHSHMIEGKITPGSLIALGISGGMVPCPSALILMLSAIALGHPGLGLILLVGFSSGLALVLMAFGMLAIYAKHLLPNSEERLKTPLFRLIPVFSSVVVICLGLIMTAVSAGWVKSLRFLS